MLKKIALLTSGGDCPGMNSCIRAIVRACKYYNIESIGIKQGFEGLLTNDIIYLGPRSVKNIVNQGGTILKTARSNDFMTEKGMEKAYSNIINNNIDGLIVIGGDGSIKGASIFSSQYSIPFVGVPATIDNDIFGIDYTIGFDTALNTVVQCIDKLRDTATSHDRVFFVEVMGRNSGFIALNTGIASGAQEIIIPEKNKSIEDLCEIIDLSDSSGKKSSIIVVSEGNTIGGIYELVKKVNLIRPNYDIRVAVLGHIQRGGAPTCYDRVLASRLGISAVESLLKGINRVVVGIKDNKIIYISIDKILTRKKKIDDDFLRIAKILSI